MMTQACRICKGTGVLLMGPFQQVCLSCNGSGKAKATAQIAQTAQDEPRAIVRHFATAMEHKLAMNDADKGTWHDDGEWNHLLYARQEMKELKQALAAYRIAQVRAFQLAVFPEEETDEARRAACEEAVAKLKEARQAVVDEAADVANYLMMLCDVIGAWPKTDARGR